MRSYQSVLILKPDFDETQVDETVEKVQGFIQTAGGSPLKIEKWGKKRLAYRVRKNRFGYYLNIYHTCDPDQIPDLEERFKHYDPVIKFMLVRVEDRQLDRVLKKGEAETAPEKSEDEPAKKETRASGEEAPSGKKPEPEGETAEKSEKP